jgi:hypothetical protein
MLLLPASEEFVWEFPSRHLSSSGSFPLDLSGLGDPTGGNTTTGLVLRVTGTHWPLHGKVEIPQGYLKRCGNKNVKNIFSTTTSCKTTFSKSNSYSLI